MKWAAALFGLFVVCVIVLADMGWLNILGFFNQIPFGDKAGHFILYGILTLLIDLAFIRAHWNISRSLIVFRIAMILALFIGLEEYSQRFFEERTSSWADLLFSYLGVGFFSLMAMRKE